jgi:carbonic anhydrase
VPPELVFDASFGELFVIRVAGNVLGPAIAGTLQYAGAHLHTPLLVVLGHEGCGAVDAAIAQRFHGEEFGNRIEILLEEIVPALDDIDPSLPHVALLDAAVEANVRRTIGRIRAAPEWEQTAAPRGIKAVGAVYDLNTGLVRFFE